MKQNPTYEEMVKRVETLEEMIARQRDDERALRESENKYRTIFDHAIEGILIVRNERMVFTNHAFEVMLGHKMETLAAKSFTAFIHPDDREKVFALYERRISGDRIRANHEFRIINASGETRWVENRSSLLVWDGKVSTLNFVIDTTERVRAKEKLKNNEVKYRTILKSAMDGFWVTDSKGNLLEVNDAYCSMSGYSTDELLSMRISDLEAIEDPAYVNEHIQAIIKKGSDRFESKHRRKDGTFFDIEVSIQFRPEEGGQGICFIRDITDRKNDELALRESEEKLRQAQKMEAVGRLAGGIAHDFNNMLSVIIGHAEMALEQLDPAGQLYADLVEIRDAGKHSADLTRQLLAFARKQTITPMVLDINKTVAGMTKMLKRLIGEDIDLAWLPCETVWPVKIDPGQIDQILANLCVNARDAIADVGKVTIETGHAEFDPIYCAEHPGFLPGEYVLLAVSDNGSGMATETLDKIFEPFFTTKEIGKGTGLGLATVYGIVKQNKGFINVYSEQGHGTTFKIYLPRYLIQTHGPPEKKKASPAEGGHETILLVEDEPAILKMTAIMLEKLGYQVVIARTPSEAIHLAQEYVGKIDLLVSDVVMPEMNGRDLARNILSTHPHLKRLFMSGYTANVIAHHGILEAGVNFIQKPFSKQGLGMKVREVLDKD